MTPAEPQPPAAPAPAAPVPRHRWSHKALAVLFATFCLEIGFFLLIYPWSPYARDFALFRPEWRAYWDNNFVRGAISGLGLVNIYIAFLEIAGLRRFAG